MYRSSSWKIVVTSQPLADVVEQANTTLAVAYSDAHLSLRRVRFHIRLVQSTLCDSFYNMPRCHAPEPYSIPVASYKHCT